ncbi:MAG: UTP--glucose-1-phosphate uridylyltransferase, partial [Methanothermobacter tenebrarum]
IGRYLLESEIFDHIKDTPPGVGGEIQLTDAMRRLDRIYGYLFDGKTYDIGNKVDWLKSSIEFALWDESIREELIDYIKGLLEEWHEEE